MPALANPKHEIVCQELAKGARYLDAYEKGGYKRNPSTASQFVKRPAIKARVKEIQEQRVEKQTEMEIVVSKNVAQKLGITKEKIIQALWFNANRCLRGQPILDENGIQTGQYSGKPDSAGANNALKLVGMECYGMFIERVEIGGPGDFSRLTDEELAKRALDDANALGLPAEATEALLLTFQPQEPSESSED
jgi:hypothetical protein